MPTPNYIRFNKKDDLVDDFIGSTYGIGSNSSKAMLWGTNKILVAGNYLSVNTISGAGNFSHVGKVNSVDISSYFKNFVGVAALNMLGTHYAFVTNSGSSAARNALICYNISGVPTYACHRVATSSSYVSFKGLCAAAYAEAYYVWFCVFEGDKVVLATVSPVGIAWTRTLSYLYNAWKVRYQLLGGIKTIIVSARQSDGGIGLVRIYNVNDPLGASILSSITAFNGDGSPRDTVVATIGGDRLLFIATSKGLATWNIDNPTNPILVGYSASLHSLWGVKIGRHNNIYYAFCTSSWGIIAYEVDENNAPVVADYMLEGFTTEYYQTSMVGDVVLADDNPSMIVIPGAARQVSDDIRKYLLASFETEEPTMTISGGIDAVIGAAGPGPGAAGYQSIVPQATVMMRAIT